MEEEDISVHITPTVYYLECCEKEPVWIKYGESEKQLKGKNGEWKCNEYRFQVSEGDYDNIKPSSDSKQEVKDIDGKKHNVYVISRKTANKNYWDEDLKNR